MTRVIDPVVLGAGAAGGSPTPSSKAPNRPPGRPATRRPDPQRQAQSQALYRELQHQLEKAGCFRPAHWASAGRVAWIAAAYALGYVVLLSEPGTVAWLLALLMVAFTMVQACFVAHEAGDGAITSNRLVSFTLRHVLMSFASGLSATYFHSLHRVHHRTLHKGSSTHASGAPPVNVYEGKVLKRLLSRNGVLFVCVRVVLRGFSLRLEGLRYVLRHPRSTRYDQLFMAAHAIAWLAVPLAIVGPADTLVNYALVGLFAGPYVGTLLMLNHVGMQAARSMEDLPVMERVTRTTRNLGRSRFEGFLLGGVNNHIEHHLFPGIPAAGLRKARAVTAQFIKRHGIAYNQGSYFQALAESVRYFRRLPPERLADESLA